MSASPVLEGSACLCEAPEPVSHRWNNFSKGSRWSPDGSVALAVSDDAMVRLYKVPDDPSGQNSSGPTPTGADPAALKPYVEVAEGGPVLDFCFFPGFTQGCPASCCFITSSQDHPIHLRDALEGSLRNSYRPYNQVDEVCHAFSLCFSADGSKILGGFPQYIRVFDLQRPGRQVEDWLLSTKKGRGQKGIIGAVAASPDRPGLYAAGSYNRSICLYQQGNRGKPVAHLADNGKDHAMGGVTQLMFSGEWLLLSGHRQDGFIRAWDLRMAGDREQEALLHRFPRPAYTHQRFSFGVQDDLLTTGDDSGNILLYSLSSLQEVGRIAGAHSRPCVAAELRPGSQASPGQGLLLSSSGSRHFPDYDVDSPEPSRSPSPQQV
ncbi:unnamed protein product, partial [Polarella glacialis]